MNHAAVDTLKEIENRSRMNEVLDGAGKVADILRFRGAFKEERDPFEEALRKCHPG